MKNLPLPGPKSVVDSPFLPLSGRINPDEKSAEQGSGAGALQSTEASIVELPRSRVSGSDKTVSGKEEAEKVLGSVLSGLKDGQEIISAHSGLDASRVFDLLDSD